MQHFRAPHPPARRNDAQSRYEILRGDELAAWLEYHDEDGAIRFTHTQVQEAHEGHGLGSELVRAALEDARRRGLTVVVQCRFVAGYLARHESEYADLLRG